MTPKRIRYALITLLVITVLAGSILIFTNLYESTDTEQQETNLNTQLLSDISRANPTGLQPVHLAEDLNPTTNKWYSSIIYSEEGLAVYPMPHSVKFQPDGLSYSIPNVNTSPDVITGPHTSSLTLRSDEIINYEIVYYDDLIVKVATLNTEGQTKGIFTIAQGVPYVTYEIVSQHNIQFTAENGIELNNNRLLTTDQNSDYYVVSNESTLLAETNYDTGDTLSIFGVPSGQDATVLIDNALHVIESSTTDFSITETVSTTYNYNTTDNNQTVFAALPHHGDIADTPSPVEYQTAYGTSPTSVGNEFSYSIDNPEYSYRLSLADLSNEEKTLIINQLEKDISSTDFDAVDTYFGGKQLYRAAQLYDVAKQLGQEDQADVILFKLKNVFDDWLDSRTVEGDRGLYYDTTLRGIIGENPSFGSELYNDHHFHYGYLIYAATLVSTHDNDFLNKNKDFIDIIIADISSKNDEVFPRLRHYDYYMGHSWASGNGAFNDGNNQESSSEAINAWVAVKAWHELTGQAELSSQATWLLANEAHSASTYWTDIDKSQSIYNGYNHNIVSINWSGKRDYATFFSPKPSAIFGIQLLPMNPFMQQHFREENNSSAKVTKALGGSKNYDQTFGDSILLYDSLTDGFESEKATEIVTSLSPENIDGALSKTYLSAWLASL